MPNTVDPTNPDDSFEGTIRVVEAYVGTNPVPLAELTGLIERVHATLVGLQEAGTPFVTKPVEATTPAVPIEKSVSRNAITCLECGESFKSLRRHLGSRHGTFPEAYRAKWKLPASYPMVAPSYSAVRSRLAKVLTGGQVAEPERRPSRTKHAAD